MVNVRNDLPLRDGSLIGCSMKNPAEAGLSEDR